MLERFGFTPTESKSYQALLKLGSSTGYGVARELGIARANIYQALEALVRRGAARKAATIPTRYSATQPAALMAELERAFRRDLVELDESLRQLPQGGGEGAADLLVLDSVGQLLGRAADAAEAASAEVLAVLGPWAGGLGESLNAARARGVATRVVSLGPSNVDGALVRPVVEHELRGYWGGLPVAVVADRSHAVFGVITTGEAASGLVTAAAGVVPFLRHLLRRELAGLA